MGVDSGVGLYGVWKLYKETKDERYMNILTSYYERQLKIGLPSKNVNTVTPLLAMSFVAEETDNERYKKWLLLHKSDGGK